METARFRGYACGMDSNRNSVGGMIREWRTRRRMSQLDLAMEAEISQRHLSFMESGRALPSRDMVLHLAEQLAIPLRQRNQLLLAAGYAPSFGERPLDHPSLAPAMEAMRMVLKGHEPYPAIAVDRHWNLIEGNAALGPILAGLEEMSLLEPPVNVLRLSLHPKGLAPRIVNLHEWRAHLIERLKRQNDMAGDPALKALEKELLGYPDGPHQGRPVQGDANAIAHPLRLRMGESVLSFIGTITVFGTPLDVTLSEIAIESFFPADEETAAHLRALARQ